MRWIAFSLLCAALSLGLNACRASFHDIKKRNQVSSVDNLGAKDGDSTAKGDDSAAKDDEPLLENTKELPEDESASYGCDGIVVVHEKGRDRNKDGILQPTEVTEVSTECRPRKPGAPTGGKDPTNPPPAQCPNQSAPKGGKCPDNAGQNDANQSDNY